MTPSTIRFGVLGLIHDHVWDNLDALVQLDGARLVAIADRNPELLEKARAAYGVETTYAEYADMIDRESLDTVLIYAENSAGAPLVELVAARGLHALVEKPMAATLAQADRMLAAARSAGTLLMVNWPNAWDPATVHALQLARAGEIGDLYQVTNRSAHGGPKEYGCTPYFYEWLYDAERNGGGALVDYGCYGANLARYLLGVPSRVTAMAGRLVKEYVTVDDNAVIVMQYPRAIAVAEASWTQIGAEPGGGPFIYGTHGTLVVHEAKPLSEFASGGKSSLDLVTAEHPHGRPVEIPELPPARRRGPAYFLDCLRHQREPEGLGNARVSRDAQEILEAALISIRRGAEVSLPLDSRLATG